MEGWSHSHVVQHGTILVCILEGKNITALRRREQKSGPLHFTKSDVFEELKAGQMLFKVSDKYSHFKKLIINLQNTS